MKKNQEGSWINWMSILAALVFGAALWIGLREINFSRPAVTVPSSSATASAPSAFSYDVPAPPTARKVAMGSLCVQVQVDVTTPVSGCSFDFLQLNPDPMPQTDPTGNCSGPGQYYFNVPQNVYDIVAKCGGAASQGRFNTVGAGMPRAIFITYPAE